MRMTAVAGVLALLLVGVPTGGMLVNGQGSELARALRVFRGFSFQHARAWTWSERAVIVVQFPLADEYHAKDVPLSGSPWRSLACIQPENLPSDFSLNEAARRAEYLVVTQAPEARECVVNRILGSEIVGGAHLRVQLKHSRVLNCRDVEQLLIEFEVPPDSRAEVMNRLRKPLPWDYRFGPPSPELLSPDGG